MGYSSPLVTIIVAALFSSGTLGGAASAQETPRPQDPMWKNEICANPTLPRSVIKSRFGGSVSVLFDIDADGQVTNIRITKADHPGKMDYSIQRALKRWRYFAYFEEGALAPRKDVALTFTYGEEQRDSCTHSSLPERPSTLGDIKDPFNQLKSCFTLVIPKTLARDKTPGYAELAYRITSDGKVKDIQLLETSHPDHLESVAKASLKRWTYYPFKKAGTDIARPDMKVRFHFGDLADGANESLCGFAPWDATHVFSVEETLIKAKQRGLDGRVN